MQHALKLADCRQEAKSFIDFISDFDNKLSKEFSMILSQNNEVILNEWFTEKGYDVSSEECSSILKNRTSLQDLSKKMKMGY